MVKTKREYIGLTFIISVVSLAITITSFATKNWVESDAIFYQTTEKSGRANYGLFSGEWKVDIKGTKFDYYITIRCIVNENVCGWSYLDTTQDQSNEIKNIFEGKQCSKSEDDENKLKCDLRFLNAGLWICTLFFVFFSLFSSLSAALLAVLNYYSNPTRDILAIKGIYICNGVSSIGYLFSLIMWGSEFAAKISKNIGISDTLTGKFSSDGLASLGYSYWILLVPMFLHVVNIGVLYYRQYQIDKEPAIPTIDMDPSKDGVLFMY